MIHARDNPWKALAMTIAFSYFDDSGTHATSVATIIGGYVATKDVWKKIEKPWRETLLEFRDKGVSCFHASPCLGQFNEFERLQRWECHYIYKQLSDILQENDVHAIWAAVKNADWDAVTDVNFKIVYPSAYDFCIDRILSPLAGWSAKHAGGSPVGLVVAEQKEHEQETTATVASWRRQKIIQERIGPIAFDYPQNLVPLQTADMLAHEVYRHAKWWEQAGVVDPCARKPAHPECFGKITSANGARLGGYYSIEDLQDLAGTILRAK